MTDVSVKQFLQSRGADPKQGIRHLAPALKAFSLKSLISMERIIIHLSDLHIGMNNNEGMEDPYWNPEKQTRLILDAIRKSYQNEDKKPILAITGDIVDYGAVSDEHVPLYISTAVSLLDEMSKEGYTVLVIPGNHDYSDEFDVDSMSWVEKVDYFDILKLKNELRSQASRRGSSPKYVSGSTYVPEGFTRFNNAFNNALEKHNYMHGGYYVDPCKDKGAAFDLAFVLVDAEDKNTNPPHSSDINNESPNPYADDSRMTVGFTELFGLDKKFFLHNKYLRLAHGYVDLPTFNSWRNRVYDAISAGALPIVCLHYWVNYWIPTLLSFEEAVAVGILNLIQPPINFDKATIKKLVAPYLGSSQAPYLASSQMNNPNLGGYGTGSLWNEISPDSPEPVPWANLFQLLGRCHLLLVGHRHKSHELQYPRQEFQNQRDMWRLLLESAKKAKSKCDEKGVRIQINAVMKDIRELMPPLDTILKTYQDNSKEDSDYKTSMHSQKPMRPLDAATALSSLVMSTSLDFDLDARYSQLNKAPMLAYYHEAGSPVPDPDTGSGWDGPRNWFYGKDKAGVPYLSWTELRVNLQTGNVSFNQINVDVDKNVPRHSGPIIVGPHDPSEP